MSPLIRKSAMAAAAAALALAGGLGSAAAQADRSTDWVESTSGSAKACFQVRQLEGFAAGEENTVNIRARISDVYQLKFITECWTLKDAKSLEIRSRDGNAPFICTGADVDIITHAPGLPAQTCVATSLKRLSLAEVQALPMRNRP